MNSLLRGQTGSPARLERSVIAHVRGETDSPLRRLYLDCAPIVARHFKLLKHVTFTREKVPENRSEYNYRLDAAQGIPEDVREMASLLKQVLTVPSPPHIDLVIALDWHSNPPDDGSYEWPKTEAGELARKKYLDKGHWRRNNAIPIAAAKLRDVIERHPLLDGADTVLSVPGSSGNYDSFGEEVATAVAAQTKKPLVLTQCRGPREQKKANSNLDLTGEFSIPNKLSGGVIIVDDLFQSGSSMSVVALAARMAGADAVYGLAITKTHKD